VSVDAIILNVDELWLKGKNRPAYFKAMKKHVKDFFEAHHPEKTSVVNENQRFVAKSSLPFEESLIEGLCMIPGLSSIVPARGIEVDYDKIVPAVLEEVEKIHGKYKTFKVETKRVLKSFPHRSMDISRWVGHKVNVHFENLKVDVHKPELRIDIKVLSDHIYISTEKYIGVGGLPVGMSGHLVTMISGGFDSPVASYLMSKRGCRQTFIFFYAYPYVGDEVKEKIEKICGQLAKFQRFSTLYVVPFGALQDKIAKTCHDEYRTLLFRKYMVKTAEMLAKRIGAEAILTGDALGQVSSQTIHNISVLDKVSDLPIFRPLLGLNKQEIIEISRKIKTHDISVIPHDDACSLFSPKHPVIKPDLEYWAKYEQENNFSEEISQALDEAEVYKLKLTGACQILS